MRNVLIEFHTKFWKRLYRQWIILQKTYFSISKINTKTNIIRGRYYEFFTWYFTFYILFYFWKLYFLKTTWTFSHLAKFLSNYIKNSSRSKTSSPTITYWVNGLIFPAPISDEEKKIKLNYCFYTSLWCLKRFYDPL